MKILSPPGLHYPITVDKLEKKVDDEVKRFDHLFTYTYETTVEEGNRYGEKHDVVRKFPVWFEAAVDGSIAQWFIKESSVIERPGTALLEIEEPCTHEVQFGSLCASCGRDMTEIDYLTKEVDSERATVNMTHDNISLLVSHGEALRAEEASKDRLLRAKKLSLIVDLDQTVIQTTCERTVAEWQADPENPNHEAVKDVQAFQLADDYLPVWYYVKARPGLKGFFDRMAQYYEMHIYTMATRTYAQAVARIIDPDRKYFGDRILSRDENYTDKLKSLHRLFPNNTEMAVIIDDRADVWGYSESLIRVPAFVFFPGTGDINASFLPKQRELELVTQASRPKAAKSSTKAKAPEEKPSQDSGAADGATDGTTPAVNGSLEDLERKLISMGTPESPEVLEQQVEEQKKVINAQITERPLLQQQLVLEKEDDDAEGADQPEAVTNGDTQPSEHHKHRSLLHDDDNGLEIVEIHLRSIHKAFYEEYYKQTAAPSLGRVAELKGEKSPKKRPVETSIPNVAELMPMIKGKPLTGCVIVFSGIIPLDSDVQKSDFAMWVKSFGAEISLAVDRNTTHVIALPDRKTTKVKKAARYKHIKIVTAEWMFQCCTRWEHVNEAPYVIELDEADRDGPVNDLDDDSLNATGDETNDEPVQSPVTLAMSADLWSEMADELADFMDESDDTSDPSASESESAQSTKSTPTKRKRKRGTDTASGSEADDSDASTSSTSRLQRRKKRTMERVTSLTNVVNADKSSSGLPSPETTGPEEEQGDDDGLTQDPQGEGADLGASDYDDGLEAEMLAEFEKYESEGDET